MAKIYTNIPMETCTLEEFCMDRHIDRDNLSLEVLRETNGTVSKSRVISSETGDEYHFYGEEYSVKQVNDNVLEKVKFKK